MTSDPIFAAMDAEQEKSTPSARQGSNDPIFAALDADSRASLAPGAAHASQFDPDHYASAMLQGEASGLPADTLARNPADAKRKALESDLDRLTASDPALAEWLGRKPERVTLAKDEFDPLAFAARLMWGGYVEGDKAKGVAKRFEAADVGMAASLQFTLADSTLNFMGRYGADESFFRQRIADVRDLSRQHRERGFATLADLGDRLAEYGQGLFDIREEAARVREQAGAERAAVAQGLTRSDPFYWAGLAADSMPAMLASLATGNVGAASLTMGSTTYADAYAQARSEGHDIEVAQATAGAQAVIEVLTERFGLSKAFGPGATAGRRAAQTIGRESAGEAAATVGQTVSDALITGKDIDPGELLAQTFDSAVLGGLMGGPEAALATRPATEADRAAAQRKLQQIVASSNEAARLVALGQVAKDLKLTGRSLAEAQDFLRSQGAGDQQVFVDAGKFVELFQSENLDPRPAAAEYTGDADALGVALASGGDVAIPMDVYLTRVVRSKVGDKLAEHARLSREALSPAELIAFKREDFLRDITGLDVAERAEASAQEQADDQAIHDDVLGQLQTAGVERSAAERYAILYKAVFRTLGQRSGLGAKALWDRYGLQVRRTTEAGRLLGQRPAAPDAFLSRVAKNEVPSARDAYGPTLAEFLAERGGVNDPKLIGEVTRLRESDQARRKTARVGTRALVQADAAMTLDNAVEAAVEAGYLPEGSDINSLLETLDRELVTERPTYAPGGRDDQIANLREAILAAQQIFAERNIDPLADPEAAMQALYGNELFQASAADQTNTKAFKDWFGDSKVVDEDGKPLVVYHGAGRDITEFATGGDAAGQTNGNRTGAWGSYFTSRPKEASIYAEMAGAESAQQVIPVFLSIQNPYVMSRQEWGRHSQRTAKAATSAEGRADARAVRAGIEASGHDGIVIRDRGFNDEWVAFHPSQIKSAIGNRGTFDPNNPSILHQGDAEHRGSLQLIPGAFRISLFDKADLSTFLHESGHFFFEVLADIAAPADAPQQIRDDYAALLAFVGKESREQVGTEQHEQIARAFEAYLREGKAPNPELTSVFARFRAWLVAIYRSLSQLNVELSDEVRGVFDRLVAVDDEIELAQVQQGMAPMFTKPEEAKALGLTDRQYEAYVALLKDATDEARADVTAQLYNAHKREAESFWREELAALTDATLADLDAQPVYRALSILRTGKLPDGSESPVGAVKLDKASLVKQHGETWVKNNLRGLYARSGGVDAEVLALKLGFPSGRAMVDALAGAKPKKELAKALAEATMRERYPDPATDGSLPERAMQAVHQHKRVAVLERELAMLAQASGQPTQPMRVLRAAAQAIVGKQRHRDIRPNEYLIAERKAAREALKAAAKGDYAAAFLAKRAQALNHELYLAALEAREDGEKIQAYALKLARPKTRAKIGKAGGDWLEQIDAILQQYSFARLSGLEADRRRAVAASLIAQRDAGVLVLPDKLLATLQADQAQRWNDVPLDELRGVGDTLKQLAHQAREANKLRIGDETRDRLEVDAEVAASVLGANRTRPENTGDPTSGEKIRKAFAQGRVIQGAATDLARELDGFEDGGAVWRYTVGVIRDAVNNRVNPALEAAQKAMADLWLRHYTKAELRALGDTQAVDGVVGKWSKARILSLALNWGNEGNREAVLLQARKRLTPEQVAALFAQMDARDVAFVQDVWAMIDGYWPAIAETARKRTGLAPKKVEASPFVFTIQGGKQIAVSGGYYPLKYESDSVKSMKDEAEDYWNAIRTGRTAKAATRDGHRIERVGSGGRTVNLDLGVIDSHLRDVIRDVHLGDAVNAVHTVLNGQAFSEAVADVGMVEWVGALQVWLKDVAAGEIGPRVWHEQAARSLRTNFTASVLTYKFTTAALQVTGLVQSAVVLGPTWMLQSVRQVTRHRTGMYRYVDGASPYMRQRAQSHQEAVQQVVDARAGAFSAGKAAMIRWGYWMIGRMQRQVDVVTWLAAEAKGMELFGNDVAKARAYADDIVTRAQGSGEFIDKAPMQRGTLNDSMRQSEWIKALTMLAGYMLTKGNAAYEQTRKTNFRKPGQALAWAGNMTSLFVIESLLLAAITGKLPDDEDDDGWLDDLLVYGGKEGFFAFWGSIPGLGITSSQLRGYDSGGVIGNSAKLLSETWEQVGQGEWDRALRKRLVSGAGLIFGTPASQVNKTLDAIDAERAGEDIGPTEYVTGPRGR